MIPENNQIAQLLDVFEGFRMAPIPEIDQYAAKGRMVLADKMQTFVSRNHPIDFVMLGYPMKSPNTRDKVIGTMPDLAEEVSLRNFADFNQAVKQVYTPGINLAIVSDGYVFNDIMEVPDSIVEQYQEVNEHFTAGHPIVWYNAKDFYDKRASMADIREKIVTQHGITAEELEHRILFDPDVNSLYRGMIKFLTLDLAIKDFPSNTQLQKAAKATAREMMFRNEAYSALIRSEFSSHIRLSMHPSVNNGSKYSFQLIPSPKAWTSPWHCALLLGKDNTLETIHRKEAVKAGHELVYKNNQPYYFQQIN